MALDADREQEWRLQAKRDRLLLSLHQGEEQLDDTAFLQRGLAIMEEITGSQISFLHFINDDEQSIELVTWSRRTLEQYCNAVFDTHYPVSAAGIWADALRQRRPVVFNDYPAHPNKQGLPTGHSPLQRLISLPVIYSDKVVMLTGVGNKAADYDAFDVETLQLFSNALWRTINRRRIERQLRDSEANLRSVLRAAPIGIASCVGQLFTEVNETFEQISGYSGAELRGRPICLLQSSQNQIQDLLSPLEQSLSGPASHRVEGRLRRKDGQVIDIELSANYIDPERPEQGLTLCLQDIGERRRTQAQLQKLALAVEQSTQAVVITDLNTRIEYVNRAFEQISGYSSQQAIGQTPRILRSGKTPSATYQQMWQRLGQGRSWKGEFINRRKNGEEFIELASIVPLRDERGAISHYVAIKDDITERKRMGEELERHRNQLEGLVSERTLQLQEAVEQAHAASRAKDLFLANMSHEIRTPMNAVVGFCHLLADSGLRPDQLRQLNKISGAAHHLLNIINDILDVSKMEAGKLKLQLADFSLHGLMQSIAALVRPLAQEKGLRLELDYAQAPRFVHGDATRLRQALLNYISNAIKFTEQGQVRIRIGSEGQGSAGHLLLFEVEDSGIGIDANSLKTIFMAFEQADNSMNKRYEGSGLGLAITQRLVRLMGGETGVESRPGQGSRFWFRLCLPPGQPQARARTESSANHLAAPRFQARVLLVEDNEINREVASGLLQNLGLSLTTAENGQQALDCLAQQPPFDLVLMDLQMPVMNGLEATQAIRAQGQYADLPVLAMTANVFEDDRRQCLAVGMNDFVAKPIDLADLYRALRRWLPESARQDRLADEQPRPALPPGSEQALAQLRGLSGLQAEQGLENLSQDLRAYLRLLGQFVRDHGADAERIAGHLAQGETEPARRRAHSIKGVAGNLGMEPLQQAAQALERALKQGQKDVDALLSDFRQQLQSLCADLQPILDGVEAAHAASNPADASAWRQALQALARLLRSDDTRVNDAYLEAEPLLLQAHPQLAPELGQAIDNFDYAKARQLVQRMIEKPQAGP
ncbi:MAG: PAS domain S-box protein [Gammaproteobacteria bacterium SHHR-1]